MDKLEKGTLVELNSGGPKMIVVKIDQEAESLKDSICCHWFSGSKFQSGLFHPLSLTIVE